MPGFIIPVAMGSSGFMGCRTMGAFPVLARSWGTVAAHAAAAQKAIRAASIGLRFTMAVYSPENQL